MKFKSDIEVQAGLKDSSGAIGASGQLLSSTGTGVSWTNSTGFVPYTGANQNVNLGIYTLLAAKGVFSSSGSANTVEIGHSSGSGIALNIIKGGDGEGLYINKTSGSGNAATIIGTLNATTLVKSGGTAAQFLKADGTVDSTTYVPTSRTITINGVTQDLSANRSFTVAGGIDALNPTANHLTKFFDSDTIQNSQVFDNGTNVMINGTGNSTFRFSVFESGTSLVGSWINMTSAQSTQNAFQINHYGTGNLIQGFGTGASLSFSVSNAGAVTGNSFIKIGGTADQYLKADGSVSTAMNSRVEVNFTATSGQTTFTTPYEVGQIDVFYNGSKLNLSEFTATNGTTVVLAQPATLNAQISIVKYIGSINGVSGTANRVAKFTGAATLGDSQITDNGTTVSVGNTGASTWGNLSKSIQIGNRASIFSFNNSTSDIGLNMFWNSSNSDYNYIETGAASFYRQSSGNHIWYSASSGTAGNAISFTQAMTLNASGNLGIGTGSDIPEGKLTVQGISAQPPISGTTANSLLQLKGSLNNELNIGSNTVAGGYGSYIQASDNNLAASYQLNLQPNGGNVIIGGYADAGFRLDVNGTGRFSSSIFSTDLNLNRGGGAWRFIPSSGESALYFSETSTGNIRMTLQGGKVGIGTTSPANILQATDNLGSTTDSSIYRPIANFYSGGNSSAFGLTIGSRPFSGNTNQGGYIQSNSSVTYRSGFDHIFQSGSGFPERMRITSGGNVGIGTINPAFKLTVQDTGSVYMAIDSTGNNYRGIIGATGSGLKIYSRILSTDASAPIAFVQGSDENVTIASNGNVLIGTTTDNGAKLNVNGIIRSTALGGFAIGNTGGIPRIQLNSGTTFAFLAPADGLAPLLASSFNTSSDYRLKEDIKPVENALERLQDIKPVNFAWKIDGTRVDGFIAHELAEVIPEAVTGEKDAIKDDGTPIYQGIDQSKIVPLLVAAIQELTARLEILENK
jgi:hypothetical protein